MVSIGLAVTLDATSLPTTLDEGTSLALPVKTRLRHNGVAMRWQWAASFSEISALRASLAAQAAEVPPAPEWSSNPREMGQRMARFINALVASREWPAQAQREMLSFLDVYSHHVPHGMLLWPLAGGGVGEELLGTGVRFEGWLSKRAITGKATSWKRRYFTLFHSGLLCYHASKPEHATPPKGCVALTPDFYVADALEHPNGMQLSDLAQTIYLGAASLDEKLGWMFRIADVIKLLERRTPELLAQGEAAAAALSDYSAAATRGRARSEEDLTQTLRTLSAMPADAVSADAGFRT